MPTIREQVAEQLTRMHQHDARFNALITALDESALRVAKHLDAIDGPQRPLRGMAVTVKDNIDVAGIRSTAGSPSHGGVPAVDDAPVVRLLREAGAVLVGKTNMAEFAMGVTGRNAAFGDCRNARDPARISGGSSSGSAVAVAAGMCAASLGTDTGGSGRIPAAVNGVVGLRPTAGRVSNRGILPVSPSFDAVAPMARDVRAVAAVLAALDRVDPADPLVDGARLRVPVESALGSAERLRIGIPRDYFFDRLDPGVLDVFRTAIDLLRTGGAQVREVVVPEVASAQERMIDIMYPEAAAVHADRLWSTPGSVDPDVLRRLRSGQQVPAASTERAREWRHRYRRGVDAAFAEVDVIATPTVPVDVPLRGSVDLAAAIREIARFTYAWSMYGGPSVSVPCGLHPMSGMPVGMQLTAPPWHDHVLLGAALRCERAVGTGDEQRDRAG